MASEAAKIVVAGATGRIGSATLRALADLGVPSTALIRAPERRHALDDPSRDTVVADFDDEEALARALAGAQRFLLCSAHGPHMAAQQLHTVRAAQRAGVERVVKVSASPASIFPGTPAAAAAAHLEIEEALRASSMHAIAVRPNAFMQVLLGQKPQIDSGVVRLPLGEARVSWVDADDVGRVAARLLAQEAPSDEVLEVTGPAGLTMDEVCAAISEVVGHPVAYQAVSDEQTRDALISRGVDPWYAEHLIEVFSLFRARDAGRTTDAVERVTGRPAMTLPDFLRRHRSALIAEHAARR